MFILFGVFTRNLSSPFLPAQLLSFAALRASSSSGAAGGDVEGRLETLKTFFDLLTLYRTDTPGEYFVSDKYGQRDEINSSQHIDNIQDVVALRDLGNRLARFYKEAVVGSTSPVLSPDKAKVLADTVEVIRLRVLDPRRQNRAVFNRIEPGSFLMGNDRELTKITRPYKLASTQTTQLVWREVVKAAKKSFPGKFDTLNEDPSHFKGDSNPVEQVSYNDAQLWFQAANALAADGAPVIGAFIPELANGAVLRLPTEAEWSFVARARGTLQGKYPFADTPEALNANTWNPENSDHQTHSVGSKNPLLFDGNTFYDMFGNVWEFVSDWIVDDSPRGGGINPQGPATGEYKMMLGGSWRQQGRGVPGLGTRNGLRPVDSDDHVGFRMLITVPEPK